MDSTFWLERWHKQQIGFHQDEINTHLQQFWPRLELPAGTTVFVPLCGKSRDMMWLRAAGYRVLGVEISPVAVEDFFTENDLQPETCESGGFTRYEADGLTILQGDFFDLRPEDVAACAACYDRASLIALPPEMRVRYAAHLAAVQAADAVTLLVTLEYEQDEMNGPPFSVSRTEVRALYEESHVVEDLLRLDILDDEPSFRSKGLTALHECVYRLHPR